MTTDVSAAVEMSFREDRTAVLATLIRQVGDFDVAEEALQDALAAAVEVWATQGVPDNPGGWLAVTARRRAIDRLRRATAQAGRARNLGSRLRLEMQGEPVETDPQTLVDDQLRLLFICCHPALDMSARVALTLRTVGGLTTGEIARAFLVAEPTMGKRIVRAKRKIADAHIPYRVPGADELPGRVEGVLNVIYLIFNEGYSASAGEELVRVDLTRQALRLARLVCDLMSDEPEAWALLSLLLLTDARRDARVDDHGRFVALEDQDRSRWNLPQLNEGLSALDTSMRGDGRGRYLLQAAVAALQSAPHGTIPWPEIARLYEDLWSIDPTPVVALNRAAAAAFAWGPHAGLELVRPLLDDPRLAQYQPLYATAAELSIRSGDAVGAERFLRRAIGLTDNGVERAELERRLVALCPPRHG